MDSLHKDSLEQNYQNLAAVDARKKIQELATHAQLCFFCTNGATGQSAGVRPMGVARADEDGTLWFISANDSHKNREIQAEPQVKLYFHGGADADFLYLQGSVTITEEKTVIQELWQSPMKVWFTEGEDDPRLSALRFVPEAGYYWATKHGKAVFMLKSLLGVVMGKTFDDSIQGKLNA